MGKNKKTVFVARLARNAAATVMVGAGAIPANQAAPAVNAPLAAQEFTIANQAVCSEGESHVSITGSFIVRVAPQPPSVWDKRLEREFRALALQEAKGALSHENAMRLELLSHWRDGLLCPQTVEETLLQIKRDRLLAKMENLLQEYVEFQEAANQTRATAG
jgi:hypothetical protein